MNGPSWIKNLSSLKEHKNGVLVSLFLKEIPAAVKKLLTFYKKHFRRPQYKNFRDFIVGLIVSVIIAIYGSAIAGSIVGVGTLASLVGVFMYGSKTRSEERKVKSSKE